MQEYRNDDGSYTSPKNGKIYKSEKALRAHLSFRKTDKFHNFSTLLGVPKDCDYCKKKYTIVSIKRHENGCYLNPINKIECKHCQKPILNFRSSKGTCSRSCSNSYFRTGEDNGNYKNDSKSKYSVICFRYHEKKCIICPEDRIVAVHHYNENHDDNRPENLVPMCPTHHQYMHSRYKDLIIEEVDKYLKEFISHRGLA